MSNQSQLNFTLPFSGFNSLTFINCFASVYMFLENVEFKNEYECPAKEGKGCNGCGNCNESAGKKQEDFYFLFDTMSGRSSVRPDFDNTYKDIDSNPETIDFLMKLTGYTYSTIKDDFASAIKNSVDNGYPAFVRMKDTSNGDFRVITGYDGESLIMADPKGAQRNPNIPAYSDIDEIVIITGKGEPVYTFADGLKRIRDVMTGNRENKIWEGCIQKFMYWDEKLQDADFDEIKRRVKRISDMSWYNFNCHNFAETFRHKIWKPMQDERLNEVYRQIDESYDNSHTRNWQIIGLNDCRDWSSRRYNELEWGYCTCIVQCLEKLREYDKEVLAAIEEAIEIVGD